MKKEKRQRRTSARMYPIIERWERGGMSQAAFARQEGLTQVVLSYWLRKYREEQAAPSPGFLSVMPAPMGRRDENGNTFARLLLPDGSELHFHQSVPGVYLRELLGW